MRIAKGVVYRSVVFLGQDEHNTHLVMILRTQSSTYEWLKSRCNRAPPSFATRELRVFKVLQTVSSSRRFPRI